MPSNYEEQIFFTLTHTHVLTEVSLEKVRVALDPWSLPIESIEPLEQGQETGEHDVISFTAQLD